MPMEGIALMLAVLAVAAWWWMRRDNDDPETDGRVGASPYHCVSVTPGKDACPTAQTIKGNRFLSAEAPPLPLPSCTSARCRCTFTHFNDRRRGDRRNPYSPQTHTYMVRGGDERRGRRGRRASYAMHMA